MPTILVVEDHAISRRMLGTLLGYKGHRVLEAADGPTALALARTERPDLIISDLLMPGMDGLALIRSVRADRALAKTPAIFYTAAYQHPEALSVGDGLDDCRVLPKPSDPLIILQAVDHALGRTDDGAAAPPVAEPPPERSLPLRGTGLQLATLLDLGIHLVRERDPERLLRIFCRAIRELLGCGRSLLAVTESGGTTRYVADGVPDDGAATADGLPPLEILERVRTERVPVRWPWPPGPSAPVTSGAAGPAQPLLVVPFATPLGVYGWWQVAERLDGTLLSDEDAELAVALGTQAALAYENILLFRHRQRQADELRESEERLRETDRRKDEFLAVLSHELRNPLAPIRNSLYVLEHAVPGSETAHQALAIIGRQTTHLARLVDDLLEVSRITRGRVQLRRERLELGEHVRQTVEDHRAAFVAAGVELRVSLAPAPTWIDADPTRIAQVIGNLLLNAAKFTPQGRQVHLTLEHEGADAVLRVRDTGVGIPPALLDRVFEPFTQADGTLDRSRGGLGLGLALVRGLVELHGGTVSAASDGPERGAEFTVRLRRTAAVPLPRPGARPLRAARARRVLVIEDSVDAADSLRHVVELMGHEVRVVHDGPSGIAAARAFRPDLVLCDIGLPGMDGYEVARAFRADPRLRDVVLVALTGYVLPENRTRAVAAGFTQHLAKPPGVKALEALLAGS